MIPFEINGNLVLLPDVYTQLTVQPALISVPPSARHLLIIGEAAKGAPASQIDLRRNYFTRFDDLKAAYGSGPIVDAARALFTTLTNPGFSSVGRVYVGKTNQSTLALRPISSPDSYGSLVAAEYGEDGNTITTQIQQVRASAKPSVSFALLPTPVDHALKVSVNGTLSSALTLSLAGLDAFIASLGSLSGVSLSSQTECVPSGNLSAAVTAGKFTVSGTFSAAPVIGSTAVISADSVIAGPNGENVGAYIVTASSTSSLALRKVLSFDDTAVIPFVEPVAVASTAIVAAHDDLRILPIFTLSVSADAPRGVSASLEIGGSNAAVGSLPATSAQASTVISTAVAAANQIEAVVSDGTLVVSLIGGYWTRKVKVGEVAEIPVDSPIAGAAKVNAGRYVVEASTASSMTLRRCFSGESIAAVSATAVDMEGALVMSSPVVSGAVPVLNVGVDEQVKVAAVRLNDKKTHDPAAMGGDVALSVSCNIPGVTDAVLSIDNRRVLKVEFSPSSVDPISLPTGKFKTLSALAERLRAAGLDAEVPSRFLSSSPTCLDMVQDMHIMSCSDGGLNGRIKRDYFAFKSFMQSHVSIISFLENDTFVFKAGLPAPEARSTFLSGAVKGGTANEDVMNVLEQAFKLPVTQIVPLFSRDARFDVDDTDTEASSTYDIQSIMSLVREHVATANTVKMRKERMAELSFKGSFEDTKAAISSEASDLCQMSFQDVYSVDGDGNARWFPPWMHAVQLAAGHAQAPLGTSMLEKQLNVTDVRHIGAASVYSEDTTPQEFNADDARSPLIDEALLAGLVFSTPETGRGIVMRSPDSTTRSNQEGTDPTAFVYERYNIRMIFVELSRDIRSAIFPAIIGQDSITADATTAANAAKGVLDAYIERGTITKYMKPDVVELDSGALKIKIKVVPVATREFVSCEIIASQT